MNLKDNPKAYWAFVTESLKEDVRDIISSIACQTFRLQSPFEHTPWRINLFRTEEFEKYSPEEQSDKLIPLRGWEGKNEASYLLSDSDMLVSYNIAQKLLKNDSNLEKFVNESKIRNLNYIVQLNHNERIDSCAYDGSVEVLQYLHEISLNLFDNSVVKRSDYTKQLFGYFENSKDSEFIISDLSRK
jgi:hypothetical protein